MIVTAQVGPTDRTERHDRARDRRIGASPRTNP
jgi:hypothetical protein